MIAKFLTNSFFESLHFLWHVYCVLFLFLIKTVCSLDCSAHCGLLRALKTIVDL